jgi:glycerol transport system substrate-binding protein
MDAAMAFLDAEIERSGALAARSRKRRCSGSSTLPQPFQGMEINVVSETITTHEYEANVLAPAFTAITGIRSPMT